jgi:hypothetical protein
MTLVRADANATSLATKNTHTSGGVVLRDSARNTIATAIAAMRGDREVSIAIRRGNETLPSQTVRVELTTNRASRQSNESASEKRGGIVINGASTLDIAVDDRFTIGDELYRVVFADPNRMVATLAEAEVVE